MNDDPPDTVEPYSNEPSIRQDKFHTPDLSDEEYAEIIGLAPENRSPNSPNHFFDSKKRARFLACLAAGWTITKACRYAPVKMDTMRAHRRRDAEFNKQVETAIEAGTDLIEDEATRRAVDGYDRPVFQGGAMVGVVREHSDSLMAILLKGRRREKFGDKTELTGANGAPLMEQVPDRKLAMALIYQLGSTLGSASLAELLGPEPEPKQIEGGSGEDK